MRFDPRVVHGDDSFEDQPDELLPLSDDGSLQLPDDLAELAAQLGDDARHLAHVYPATSVKLVESLSTPRRRMALSYVAAGLGLLLAVFSWGLSRIVSWQQPQRPTSTEMALEPTTHNEASHPAVDRFSPTVGEEQTVPVSFESQPSSLLLYELTGPELEGVYDLLEPMPQQEVAF